MIQTCSTQNQGFSSTSLAEMFDMIGGWFFGGMAIAKFVGKDA